MASQRTARVLHGRLTHWAVSSANVPLEPAFRLPPQRAFFRPPRSSALPNGQGEFEPPSLSNTGDTTMMNGATQRLSAGPLSVLSAGGTWRVAALQVRIGGWSGRSSWSMSRPNQALRTQYRDAIPRAVRLRSPAHTCRHGGFEGSVRVKFTGPMPQMAITAGSLWSRITPS
jgi:hypothetical protein